jgi:SAM-dependent methyltransferase
MSDEDALMDNLRAHYGAAARAASEAAITPGTSSGRRAIGDPSGSSTEAGCSAFGARLYDPGDLNGLPPTAVAASLGCANPVALADLETGEVVLDLGSGGGIDVLLSARRVGPTGWVYGLDMTPEMLDLARANQARAGIANVEFLEGRIEAVPLPDASVDVVVSNCVIGLSARKDAVLREAFRLLRAGGRFAVADVVADCELDGQHTAATAQWAACLAGALTRDQYRTQLAAAGFLDIAIVDSHALSEKLSSVLVRARKGPRTTERAIPGA